MAKIGVFWVIDGKNIDGYKESLESGEIYGSTIQPTFDHFSYWEKFVSRHPEFKLLEYDDLPRGRVVYDRKKECFLIISSRKLLEDKELIKRISHFFEISETPKLVWDEHYEISR